MVRDWGPWTEVKLSALDRYLEAFTTASKRARGRTLYLDLFAGAADNVGRETGESIEGSAMRALAVSPPFGKLIFCEKSPTAATSLRMRLEDRFPGRDFIVRPEDCNVAIRNVLERLEVSWRYAPTFAFVDQYSAQVTWATVEFLSRWKARGKIEQWIYFGDSFYPRGLKGPNGTKNAAFALRLDAMFGTRAWRQIMAARDDDVLAGRQAQLELINLYRWRLQHDLGYAMTRPLAVPRDDGRPLYTLIFATTHPVGDKIMRSVFDLAESDFRAMVDRKEDARRRDRLFGRDVQDGLFSGEEYYQGGSLGASSGPAPMLISEPKPPFEYDREWSEDG